MCSEVLAWKRLIGHTLAMDEQISLITAIFSDENQVEMVQHLSGNDAQAFVDTISEVSFCTFSLPKSWFPLKPPHPVG